MKTNVNKVELTGFAGMDAEVKEIRKGVKVANFRLATSEGYKNSNGEWVNSTSWHTIVLWNDMAKKAADIVKKGARLCVVGKISYKNYQNKEGQSRLAVDIMANNIELIEKTSKNINN